MGGEREGGSGRGLGNGQRLGEMERECGGWRESVGIGGEGDRLQKDL